MSASIIQTDTENNKNLVYTEFNSEIRPWRLYTTNIYHDPSLVTDTTYTPIAGTNYDAHINTLTIEASGSDIEFYTKEVNKTFFNGLVDISKSLLVRGDVSFNNILDVSNILKVGKASIDGVNGRFSHIDNNNDVSYALKQEADGKTYINAPSNENVFMCINNHKYTILTTDGNFGIGITSPVEKLEVNGNISCIALVPTSDDRLKHNERKINNGLEVIRRLEPQVYDKTQEFKKMDFSGVIDSPYTIEAGFIAQEVNTISDISYCVGGGDYINTNGEVVERSYNLNYNNIFTYNVAATKELDSLISGFSNEINRLKDENRLMKDRINKLVDKCGLGIRNRV
tara:strand:+ start:2736 stop:3761 length:1026 start_codon:yes stop_codon:yes gene_type:complete